MGRDMAMLTIGPSMNDGGWVVRWSTAILGTVLLGGTAIYSLVDSEGLLVESAELFLPFVSGVVVVLFGYRLAGRADRYDRQEYGLIALAMIAGALVFAALIGWFVIVMTLAGSRPAKVGYLFLNGIAIGMVGAVYVARFHVRVERQRYALESTEARYAALFETLRDPLLVADPERRIVDCNPAFVERFGYELEEIAGEPTAVIYKDRAEYEALGQSVRSHEDDPGFSVTVHYRTKSGEVFPGETSVFTLTDDEGTVTAMVGAIRDISARIERTKQLQVMDRLLRHNLRNELNVMLGYADLVRERGDSVIADHASLIEERGYHLLETAEKQREIIGIISTEPTPREIDLGAILGGLREWMVRSFPEATVEVDVPADLAVVGVPELSRAFREIGENAVSHNDSAEPALDVGVVATENWVTVEFSDDGPGIPADEFGVVLGDEDMNPLDHESGVGLWLVKHIVDRAGGTLRFEDRVPQGTTVRVTLPRVV